MATDQAFKMWHPGEQAVQAIIQLPERVSISAIANKLPEQHRIFHTSRLHYVPLTTLDTEGRPWASILCSATGTTSFITSPSETSLHIDARLWPGDPISTNLSEFGKDTVQGGRILASGLGLEPATRRRNKFAGYIVCAVFSGWDLPLELAVSHALGLCPKYINIRKLTPYAHAAPRVVYERMHLCEGERLPQDVISFIHAADTAFLATSYVAKPEDQNVHPSRVGTNHRGGRPGFVRVRPGDGRTLVLPNYAGNRMMNSLGNIYVTPLAGLVFPSFTTGSILYVSGKAETLFGAPARKLMPHVNVVTTIYVTGFSFVDNALPLRELPDTTAERSPYSPPICYLSEEEPPDVPYDDVTLTLVKTKVHNDSLATFTFETSRPIEIRPSQNCVLDLSEFVRKRSHELLEWTEGPATQNDDCVRTWTASVPPTPSSPCLLSITMRKITGGLITPILYRIAQHANLKQQGEENDVSALGITARLRGIGGDLPVPHALAACDGGRRLLWIAGGIGITPLLSLTRYVMGLAKRGYGMWDIVLVVSTREPDVTLELLNDAFGSQEHTRDERAQAQSITEEHCAPVDLGFAVHVFSPSADPAVARPPSDLPTFASLSMHEGRIDDSGQLFGSVDAVGREVQICGPLPFVLNAMKSLSAAGVDPERVRRERFTY